MSEISRQIGAFLLENANNLLKFCPPRQDSTSTELVDHLLGRDY
jgi:hypothetical protein